VEVFKRKTHKFVGSTFRSRKREKRGKTLYWTELVRRKKADRLRVDQADAVVSDYSGDQSSHRNQTSEMAIDWGIGETQVRKMSVA